MPLSPGPSRASRAAAGLFAAAGLLAGCGEGAGPPPDTDLRFEDRAAALGLGRTGQSYSAAAADFDRDGWPDLAVSRHGTIGLHRNRQGRGFEDVSGIGRFERGDTHGVSWLDWNMDGWPDLYVSRGALRGRIKRSNRLHLNRGGQAFELADMSGVLGNAAGRGRSATPWDLNADGRLDLLILNYYQPDRPQRLALSDGDGYRDAARELGWHDREAQTATAFRLGDETAFVLTGHGADAGHVFRRNEAGRFEDVTDAVGISPGQSSNVTAAAVGDVDNDGDEDLYLVRAPWRGQGAAATDEGLAFRYARGMTRDRAGLRFEAAGAFTVQVWAEGHVRHESLYLGGGARVATQEVVRVSPDDPVLDGKPSLADAAGGAYLWRTAPGAYELRYRPGPGGPAEVTGRIRAEGGKLGLAGQYGDRALGGEAPNTLYINEGGRFRASDAAADPGSGRDALFTDFDNDGDLDLYVLNGGELFTNPPNRLYENRGDLGFVDVTGAAGVAGTRHGRGATVLAFDHDRDGRMDLFLTNGEGAPPRRHEGPYELFHNLSPAGHWLRIRLEATASNPMALGARVAVTTPAGRQQRYVRAATGALVTSWLPLHFGLGGADAADVTVHWPSGRVQQARAEADTLITLTEPTE